MAPVIHIAEKAGKHEKVMNQAKAVSKHFTPIRAGYLLPCIRISGPCAVADLLWTFLRPEGLVRVLGYLADRLQDSFMTCRSNPLAAI